MRITTRSVMCR